MSYTKLFSSILDSTIWQAPDHVRIVWITMLAMKDRDGIVEASIPGLAKRAGQPLEATEDALRVLLAPDPYSRTKDHDGRRIEAIDGGWVVLNHDRYRDKMDPDEQREKRNQRQARWRAKHKAAGVDAGETPVDAGRRRSPHSDADPDQRSGSLSPDLRSTPSQLPDPDPPAIVRAEREELARAVSIPPPAPPAPQLRDRRLKLNHDAWQYAALEHARLRGEGISPTTIPWPPMPGGAAMHDLVARVAELAAQSDPPDLEAAGQILKRRVDVAVAEAKREGHLRWFTPTRLWDAKSFWRAVEQTPEEAGARHPPARAGPRLVPDEPIRRLKTL